jgi:hypothetical protein
MHFGERYSQLLPFCEFVFGPGSEGEKVLTCTEVRCATLCQILEICLRMPQNNVACFQALHLSFVQFDASVLLWGSSL